MKETNKRLFIKLDKGMEETLKLYCDASGEDFSYLFKMIGMLVGISEKQTKEESGVVGVSEQKDTLIHSLMSVCFFTGVFIAKKHPEFIKEFKYKKIKGEDSEKKEALPNYMG